jgi:hypothetical protein
LLVGVCILPLWGWMLFDFVFIVFIFVLSLFCYLVLFLLLLLKIHHGKRSTQLPKFSRPLNTTQGKRIRIYNIQETHPKRCHNTQRLVSSIRA